MAGESIHDRLGLPPEFPDLASKLGVSESALSGQWPMHGLRHRPGPVTNGWFIWSGLYSDADDFFLPLHFQHVADRLPAVVPYLALPPGYRFLIAPRTRRRLVRRHAPRGRPGSNLTSPQPILVYVVKPAFHEFRQQAPRMAVFWLAIAVAVFPIGLLYGFSPAKAAAVALSMVPLGLSMIGGMWLHPVWGGAIPTRERLAVGFGWLLVMFLPAAGLSVLVLLTAGRLLGVEG